MPVEDKSAYPGIGPNRIEISTLYYIEVATSGFGSGYGIGTMENPFKVLLGASGLDQLDAYSDAIEAMQGSRPSLIDLNAPDPDNGGGSDRGGGGGGYGIRPNAASRPQWLPANIIDSAVLTKRGWMARSAGCGNPNAYELIVAGNFVRENDYNSPPNIYNGFYPISRLLTGISGGQLRGFLIEVVDPNKLLTGQTISAGATTGMPDGLWVRKASTDDAPTDLFIIQGTPTGATSGTCQIIFEDSEGAFTVGEVTYDIQE